MAECVVLNADGTLTPTGEPVAQCSGYVLVSGSEYGVYDAVQQALAFPDASTAMQFFLAAWGVVVVSYIVSRWVGSVVSMFR